MGKDKSSSKDSVHQAIYASILTGKKPMVVIYDTDGELGKWERQIEAVCKALGIKYLWI